MYFDSFFFFFKCLSLDHNNKKKQIKCIVTVDVYIYIYIYKAKKTVNKQIKAQLLLNNTKDRNVEHIDSFIL